MRPVAGEGDDVVRRTLVRRVGAVQGLWVRERSAGKRDERSKMYLTHGEHLPEERSERHGSQNTEQRSSVESATTR